MTEAQILNQVCQYLKYQYPNVIYRVDFAAGMKMTIGQAVRQKKLQHGRAYPDLFIAEPNGEYNGLYIELKKYGEKVFTAKGKFKSPHIKEQYYMLEKLKDKGFMAEFAFGFDNCKYIIDKYMKMC